MLAAVECKHKILGQTMNRLTREKRAQILGLMCEGMSIRAIVRTTGASKNTVVKLLEDAGQAFSEFQDQMLRGLKSQRVQVDEIWSFIYCKDKNVNRAKSAPPHAGDVWTWVAIDADTKLIPSWFVGDRSGESARPFLLDLHDRLATRVQLTSDGHRAYLDTVSDAFANEVDFAQLVKVYSTPAVEPEASRRYSPTECIGCKRNVVMGDPDPDHVSTSYAERSNLSIRMGLRRFTRLTNAFSKKVKNHVHGLSIYFMHYNFVRIHQTLRVTPAMAAGVTNRLWELNDMVRVLEAWEAEQEKAAIRASVQKPAVQEDFPN
jgi:IS1 family transposase